MKSSTWLLVFLTILGCRAPDALQSKAASDAMWGPERSGLRLRVDAPARVARGDAVTCELRVLVDRSATAAVPTIEVRPPAYFSRLRLTPVDGGDPVLVVPTDPSAGMPDPLPPGEPADRIVFDALSATEGALGSVDWRRAPGGRDVHGGSRVRARIRADLRRPSTSHVHGGLRRGARSRGVLRAAVAGGRGAGREVGRTRGAWVDDRRHRRPK